MNNEIERSPAQSYAEAVTRIQALQARDTDQINPVSHTSFLTHGHKTERAILLIHGYTSSPRVYIKFADEFFQRGYNVLVPRLPHHGLKDRMTTELQNLTEQEMLAAVREAVDIMQGLGDQVTVAGISMGGLLALWVAQHCADVSLACSISPALAFKIIPLALTVPAIKAFMWTPNQFWWWDPNNKDTPVPPLHAYPRYSTRGLARMTNIGFKVRAEASHAKPKAKSVLVITNPTDEHLNNAYAHQIVERWREIGAQNIRTYEFDPKLELLHDLMDPDQPYQRIDLVYPILLEMITGSVVEK